MKHAKTYQDVTKIFYRPEIYKCLECQKSLKRSSTLSQRTVVTMHGVIKVIHGGYSCTNLACRAQKRTYRSAEADALALPGFTFGLDIVIFAGKLHLGEHQTVDEVHENISKRLAPLGVSISRREITYLFDAFSTLLRATCDLRSDEEWKKEVEKNGGIIVSIDGIKPDQGNETIYIVRDMLTGRLLTAENVTDNSTEKIKQILAPIVELSVPVLGTISDAQLAEIQGLTQLWPDAPHQTCQFHALRDAGAKAMAEDRRVKKEIRKKIQSRLKDLRKEIKGQKQQAGEAEKEQLDILDEYALGCQAVLNQDGIAPFDYKGIDAYDTLDDIADSLEKIKKKGHFNSVGILLQLNYLEQLLNEREGWREQIESIRRMRQWVLDAEHILDGSWAEPSDEIKDEIQKKYDEQRPEHPQEEQKEEYISKLEQSKKQGLVTNKDVSERFSIFIQNLDQKLDNGTLTQKEHKCLEHFLKTLDNVYPYLIQCYDQENFPRTNNKTEGCIHKIKARYRRISGRKNWNKYLLKHGRSVGLYDWWESDADRWKQFEVLAQNITKECWVQNRQEQSSSHNGQLVRYRFCHKPQKYLTVLESRWEASASLNLDSQSPPLP
jgi:hypothetical protein